MKKFLHFLFFFFFFVFFVFLAVLMSSTDGGFGSLGGGAGGFRLSDLRIKGGRWDTGRGVGGFGVLSSSSIFRFLWPGGALFLFIRNRYMFWLPSVMWSLLTSWECDGSAKDGWTRIVRFWSFKSFPFFVPANCVSYQRLKIIRKNLVIYSFLGK